MPVLALCSARLTSFTFTCACLAVCLANCRALLRGQAAHGLAPLFHGLLPLFNCHLWAFALLRLRFVAIICQRRRHE